MPLPNVPVCPASDGPCQDSSQIPSHPIPSHLLLLLPGRQCVLDRHSAIDPCAAVCSHDTSSLSHSRSLCRFQTPSADVLAASPFGHLRCSVRPYQSGRGWRLLCSKTPASEASAPVTSA